jgi:hypothetical protein
MSRNPAVVLYDASGNAFAVQNGVAIPVSTPALMVGASDGVNARYLKSDASGRPSMDLERWFGSAAPTVGQKAMAASIPVTFASDQTAITVSLLEANATSDLAQGKSIASGSGADAYIPIYATVYNEQTSNAQRSMSSASAADAAAGTGARTVEIEYHDSAFAGPFFETVTLNGVTPVNTVATDICFINRMVVKTAGSSGRNAGIITLFAATGGGGGAVASVGTANLFVDTIGSPAVNGDNSTLLAHHYIPNGKTATLATVTGGTTGNQTGVIFLVARGPLVTSPEIIIGDPLTVGLNATGVVRQLGIPIKIVGPSRVRLVAVPAGNGTSYWGSFDFSEVNT